MKVLVTGSSGFIGKAVCRMLDAQGHEVLDFDRIVDGKILETRDLGSGDNATFSLQRDVSTADAVLHLAGNADWAAHSDPRVMTADIAAAAQVLNACVSAHKPVVVASSAYALTRNTFYGVTKGAIEDLATLYRERGGHQVSTTRIFNVYGPGQELAGTYASTVTLNLFRNFKRGDFTVRSTNVQRDFVYIDDAAKALIQALILTTQGKVSVCEVGSGELVSVWDVAQHMVQAFHKLLPERQVLELQDISDGSAPLHEPYRRPAWPVLAPSVSLQEGLQRTVLHLFHTVAQPSTG